LNGDASLNGIGRLSGALSGHALKITLHRTIAALGLLHLLSEGDFDGTVAPPVQDGAAQERAG
jgi:hypothetical protein